MTYEVGSVALDLPIDWDEIISIEPAGRKPTYDLEIAEHHNFIANDILVHNSHAADYGVISVQTAFLKTHYPAEYMSALMSVFKDDAGKIAMYAADLCTLPASLAGVPAISVPCGLADGLPVGLQIMAPALADDRVYRVAAAVEAALDQRRGHPLLAEAKGLDDE